MMKKFLFTTLLLFAAFTLGTSASSDHSSKNVNTHVINNVGVAPKSAKHVMFTETETINYYSPSYYDAGYWYPGQTAGWYFVLDLEAGGNGPGSTHDATWEMGIYMEVTDQWNSKYTKYFSFTVPPCYYHYHTHIFDMTSELSYGEHFADNPPMIIDHFWITS